MVAFAVLLPLVLLPIAALAVGAGQVAAAQARLAEAAGLAAEDASGWLDVGALRAGRGWMLDAPAATAAATASMAARDPAALVESVTVTADRVAISCRERVDLPLGAFSGGSPLSVRATAVARLTPGYSRPSSLRPLPARSF